MTPNDHERPEDRFQELWTCYLEGELDETGVASLGELLAQHEHLLRRAAGLYQTHRLLGVLAANKRTGSEAFVRETLKRLPADSERFTQQVMERQRGHPPDDTISSVEAGGQKPHHRTRTVTLAAWMAAALLIMLALFVWLDAVSPPSPAATLAQSEPVRMTRLARAQFFGELTPQARSPVQTGKEYILTSGIAELLFPSGATAILEAPAVFRVLAADLLAMDAGHCSVHAPPGAEGFRLETPATTVIDRGTRFSVKVNENSETEVQVIEGMADVYPVTGLPQNGAATLASPRDISVLSLEYRLTDEQALRVLNQQAPTAAPASFDPSAYRASLPDRLVSFTATTAADGGAEFLTSVTVQRDGEEVRHRVEELIPAELVWFKPAPGVKVPGHLMGPATLPEDRRALIASPSLAAGLINPGGGSKPLTTDPVLQHDPSRGITGTPGMAVRFHQPVRNGPGPDVVFFEIQPVSLPPEGDAFHVSPLKFAPGRKSLTIRAYDVNMLSPEALRVTRPHLHYSNHRTVHSLDDLLAFPFESRPFSMVYRVVAIGIDLSDLGYAPGELVEGLFFQDAEDDDLRVDPVFIAGLP